MSVYNQPLPPGAPEPSTEALSVQTALLDHLHEAMGENGMRFDQYMEQALYAPGLGYYSAGSLKFGEDGDFTTAAEGGPWFARTLARQAAEILDAVEDGDILELGAGSGRLATDLLLELEQLGALPNTYFILDLSADLRERQRQTLSQDAPHLLDKVVWLDTLPDSINGLIFGNEVLDALPVQLFRVQSDGVEEAWVQDSDSGLQMQWQAASDEVAQAVKHIDDTQGPMPEGYVSELCLPLQGWLEGLSQCLHQGAVLFIDYGYTRREYYHPERNQGTLICHYRHQAHPNPLILAGLQDITANVDFTAVAEAGHAAGLQPIGYTTQAFFLMGAGLLKLLEQLDPADMTNYMEAAQAVKRLTLPTLMGERFKVIVFNKGLTLDWCGFSERNLLNTL